MWQAGVANNVLACPTPHPPPVPLWVSEQSKEHQFRQIKEFPTLKDLLAMHNDKRGGPPRGLVDTDSLAQASALYMPRTMFLKPIWNCPHHVPGPNAPILAAMKDQRLTSQILDTLPHAVTGAIRGYLNRIKSSANTEWPNSAFELLDRQDLLKLKGQGGELDDLVEIEVR